MQPFNTIDLEVLSSVVGGIGPMGAPGGQGPGPGAGQDGPPPPRTWKQVGKQYARACVQGAGENVMMMGMMGGLGGPAGALGAAGLGCAMGVGMQGMQDGINKVFGPDDGGY